jgi:peptidoglycan glycosyltransferase
VNAPVRRLSIVVALLFGMLLVSTTWIQYVFGEGPQRPRRTTGARCCRVTPSERGSDPCRPDQAVAELTPTDDQFKYIRKYSNGPALRPRDRLLLLLRCQRRARERRELLPALGSLATSSSTVASPTCSPDARPQGANLQTDARPRGPTSGQSTAMTGSQRGAARSPSTRRPARSSRWCPTRRYDPNDVGRATTSKPSTTAYKALDDRHDAAAGQPQPSAATSIHRGPSSRSITAASALSTGEYTRGQQDAARTSRAWSCPGTTAEPGRTCSTTSCRVDPTTRRPSPDAMRISCNTAFGWLGMEFGGPPCVQQAAKFGFGDQLTVPMRVTPSSVPPNSTCPSWPSPPSASTTCGSHRCRWRWSRPGSPTTGRHEALPRAVGPRPDLSTIETAEPQELSQAITPDVAAAVDGDDGGAS